MPCSGDVLLAALVACQEITLRMVAANMGIAIEHLEVVAEADWDPRGTLAMGREYPIGIRAITCRTTVTISGDERGERAERLLRSAERYCVVLDTLRTSVEVDGGSARTRLNSANSGPEAHASSMAACRDSLLGKCL